MLAVVQRVRQAAVKVGEEELARVGRGLVAFVGVEQGDGEDEAKYLAAKIGHLRVFPDSQDRMNLALGDLGYELLLVPNFTVAGDCRKGRRPSFDRAAEPDKAEWLLQRLGEMLESEKIKVSWGAFGSKMEVSVENDGPVTLLIDSGKRL